MSQKERADGPRDIADTERRQCQESPGCRIIVWEKNPSKDEGGGSAVDKKIIVFECAADPAGERGLLRRFYSLWLVRSFRFVDRVSSYFAFPPNILAYAITVRTSVGPSSILTVSYLGAGGIQPPSGPAAALEWSGWTSRTHAHSGPRHPAGLRHRCSGGSI
jgi:hypothetical protein